jgi:hypothetical protein
MQLQHQGFAHSRTQGTVQSVDALRERTLAKLWKEQNPPTGSFGVQPVLPALVPDCTARDAQVAATVIQWLGSQVGFHFLEEAMTAAGYAIIAKP